MALTPADLRAFAQDIAAEFNAGKIPHPVHLSDGNEDALIEAFRQVGQNDWCLGGWRFHSQCLLKGVPPAELKAAIMRGESIGLAFPEHRILCSAIVGGILPIALGIALGIKRAGGSEWVHCWLGDMAERGGMFHECREFAMGHRLPIRWIVEDNGMSVCTPTAEVWGEPTPPNIVRYEYKSKWPHAGAGKRVEF